MYVVIESLTRSFSQRI